MGARRLNGKWRLVAMIEVDGRKQRVAIVPWLHVAGAMDDARYEPLFRPLDLVQQDIPLRPNADDLASADGVDAGLIGEARPMLPDEGDGGGREIAAAPSRQI